MKLEIDWPELLTISHSRLKVWRRCQMQHHYRYYQGLRRIKKGLPLVVGTAVHAMIEAHHERGVWTPELEAFRAEFNKLFREEQAELGDLPTATGKIVDGYLATYRDDGLTYPKRRRNRSTEIEVCVDLDSQTRFIGYVDAFPQDDQGRNWVMDHKTCKNIPDEETRFADLQLLTYVWLLPQLGYPTPDGVIWDYIRTKPPTRPEVLKNGSISKAKSIDTTYDVYMQTVREELGEAALPDYEEFAQTLKGKEEKFYRRIALPHPPKVMVESVVRDIMATTAEIRFLGPNAQVRNMTRDCKQCSYYTICQAEVRGLDSDYIRQTEFETKEKRNVEETNDLAGTGSSGEEE